MIKKAVVAAVAIALTSSVAQAKEKNEFTKEEGVGMVSGAAAGAIVGGPIGAFIGLLVGGVMGDNVGTAQRAQLSAQQAQEHAQQLEQDLIDTRIALAKASEPAAVTSPPTRIIAPSTWTKSGKFQLSGRGAARMASVIMRRASRSCR